MRKPETPDPEVDAYIAEAANHEITMLHAEALYGEVGLFEGEQRGLWPLQARD
jgi:hypothetical protein